MRIETVHTKWVEAQRRIQVANQLAQIIHENNMKYTTVGRAVLEEQDYWHKTAHRLEKRLQAAGWFEPAGPTEIA